VRNISGCKERTCETCVGFLCFIKSWIFLTSLVTVNLIKKDPSAQDSMGFYVLHCWHSVVLCN
jgi:hypothetical protein